MTEPDCGSDLAAVRTRAVRDGNHYILNGQKVFITNGMNADAMVVACKIESPEESSGGNPKKKPISLIVVEGDSLKYVRRRQLEKMGRHALDSPTFFEDCKVPVGNLLGKEGKGFSYMMHD